MCDNDEFVGRVLNRREIVAALGAAGAWMLMGCSNGSDDDDLTATTGGQLQSTLTPGQIETSGESSTEPPATSTAGGTANAGSAVAPEATADADESASAATVDVIPACVVSPELTEGPYFVDELLNRSDIRTDPSSGESEDGVPLALTMRVLQVGSNGCVPLEGALVDIWQCNALGAYSDVDDPGFSTRGQQFLRGNQLTGSDGLVQFATIYPGWYQGRTVHIHFKIRSGMDTATGYEFTSQFFFDDELSDQVFRNPPYSSKGERGIRNTNDGIYGQSGDQLTLGVTASGDGYASAFDIGIVI